MRLIQSPIQVGVVFAASRKLGKVSEMLPLLRFRSQVRRRQREVFMEQRNRRHRTCRICDQPEAFLPRIEAFRQIGAPEGRRACRLETVGRPSLGTPSCHALALCVGGSNSKADQRRGYAGHIKRARYLHAIGGVETNDRLRDDYSLGDVLASDTVAALRVLDGFEIANFHRGPT